MPFPSPIAAIGRMSVPLLNALLVEAMTIVQQRRAAVFERLASLGESVVRIEVSDLPIAFSLALGSRPDRPWLRVTPEVLPGTTAVVRGSLGTLLGVFEGRYDGDALFFARTLFFEGDTGVVVGLRNAIDGEDIDLAADLLSVLGPLGPPLRRLVTLVAETVGRTAFEFDQAARLRQGALDRRQD